MRTERSLAASNVLSSGFSFVRPLPDLICTVSQLFLSDRRHTFEAPPVPPAARLRSVAEEGCRRFSQVTAYWCSYIVMIYQMDTLFINLIIEKPLSLCYNSAINMSVSQINYHG